MSSTLGRWLDVAWFSKDRRTSGAATPVELGRLPTTTLVDDVVVHGSRAWMREDDAWFEVDVSTPSAPERGAAYPMGPPSEAGFIFDGPVTWEGGALSNYADAPLGPPTFVAVIDAPPGRTIAGEIRGIGQARFASSVTG